ncbi:hypothetical protein ACPESV_29725 [Streptomyces umbrinus]
MVWLTPHPRVAADRSERHFISGWTRVPNGVLHGVPECRTGHVEAGNSA